MKKTLDRFLPERSYMDFYFPDGDSRLRVRIPFYEDVNISEQKEANLVNYSPISRSSALYSYAGAKSRKFKLQFPITLQHVFAESKVANVFDSILKYTGDGKYQERAKFKNPLNRPGKSNNADSQDSVVDSPAVIARSMFEGMNPAIARAGQEKSNAFLDFLDVFGSSQKPEQSKEFDAVISIIVWWVNIIRSSVTNSASNPVDGPPIVRLFHGLLYSDTPCVVRNYNISYDQSAGKDLRTLMDNRIIISMDLEEVRAGDFGDFEPGNVVKGDNLAGWEELLDKGTMDPFITMFQWSEHLTDIRKEDTIS